MAIPWSAQTLVMGHFSVAAADRLRTTAKSEIAAWTSRLKVTLVSRRLGNYDDCPGNQLNRSRLAEQRRRSMDELVLPSEITLPNELQETKEAKEERLFLEGPQSRFKEFVRAIRIFREIIHGFRKLHFIGPCATVFGSARFPETHPYYVLARQVGAELAKAGFTVMTGGGPGIMEAANRGAKDVHGRSVGCNIVLPKEQHPNPYLDQFVEFHYFFVRKLMLAKYSYAPTEIAQLISQVAMKSFGLKRGLPKPRWWLLESDPLSKYR